MIQAMPGKVICYEVDENELRDSPIAIAFIRKQKPLAGLVIAVSDTFYNIKGKEFHCPVEVGDLAFFKKVGPTRTTLGGRFGDHDFIFAWFEDIIGFIREGDPEIKGLSCKKSSQTCEQP